MTKNPGSEWANSNPRMQIAKMAEILAFSPSQSQQGLETSASALYSPAQLSTWIKAGISPAVLRKA
ncbi:hypothetical protein E4188_20735 [Aeromonas media]|uniref:Helix-turn-helix domain-containing protein n=1 Tax=Aeromonas media TaxID=651 RepID=A0ABX6NZB8_AERME|nr:hypothetical protein E4188_20735 [Aeromonas media]